VHTGLLMGIAEKNRPLERPRCGWKDNIKLDMQEVGWWHGLDWSVSWKGQVAGSC